MKAIIVEDDLASNGPRAGALMENDFRFMPGAKPGDRKLLFSWFQTGYARFELRASAHLSRPNIAGLK